MGKTAILTGTKNARSGQQEPIPQPTCAGSQGGAEGDFGMITTHRSWGTAYAEALPANLCPVRDAGRKTRPDQTTPALARP